MGVDIGGWVEVKPDWYDPQEPDRLESLNRWVGIISHVGFIVGRDYDMFASIFGVRPFGAGDDHSPSAAKGRGIPGDASDEVREAVERLSQLPPDAFFGASWVKWAELKSAGKPLHTLNVEWKTLFALMEVLARRYGDDGVRLVAWFGW